MQQPTSFSPQALRRRRRAGGWTVTELAYNVHCSASAIEHYELANRTPAPAMVQRLAQALHVEMADLYADDPDEVAAP